ncbi:MAG: RNA polymerase sigma-70 factor [Muribaculaceae bacterium]|nr:RNA polymerase sigma-70 factor [Muribaculaceae bacterium]
MKSSEFDIYFRKLYLPLGMFALRMVEDADVAEDLVSNTFANVWQKMVDGIEIINFKAYLYQSVRNECLVFLRDKKEMVSLENILEVDEETIDTSERDAKIWKAIDQLPEKCRQVFLLSKRDGLSNEEIAKEMGISIKTVKNQMTKAFSRLREALSSGHKPFFLPFL